MKGTTAQAEGDAEIASIKNIEQAAETISQGSLRNVYSSFMRIRFGDTYTTYGYALEWAGRFINGSPSRFMDRESLNAYDEALEENGFSVPFRSWERWLQ